MKKYKHFNSIILWSVAEYHIVRKIRMVCIIQYFNFSQAKTAHWMLFYEGFILLSLLCFAFEWADRNFV